LNLNEHLVKRAKATFYDEVTKEFIEPGLKYAQVKDLGKKPTTMAMTVRQRLKTDLKH